MAGRGALVHRAEVAAAQLQREGVSVEIIDLRSLSPYDWEAIAATVTKTHRVIIAYEESPYCQSPVFFSPYDR